MDNGIRENNHRRELGQLYLLQGRALGPRHLPAGWHHLLRQGGKEGGNGLGKLLLE